MGCKALRIGLALFLAGCVLFLAPILLESQAQAQGGSTISLPDMAIRNQVFHLTRHFWALQNVQKAITNLVQTTKNLVSLHMSGSESTIYVAPGGDCGEKTPCYDHPQDAVDAANSGDVIKVAADTYTGVSAREDVVQVVYLSKGVTIRGGYTTTNWTTSDPNANPTTLDAEGQGRVLYITGDISPTIEGLHITGGNASGLGGGPGGGDAGGGVYLDSSDAALRGNSVTSNTAQYGGGLYLRDSDNATVNGNVVQDNTAGAGWEGYGGGLYLSASNAEVAGNTVRANFAWISGGGLYLFNSDAKLGGNTVCVNLAENGGGLYLDGSNPTLSGDTIISNTLYTYWGNGGGLYLDRSNAKLINAVVADNQANRLGSGLYVEGSSPRLLHTTFARNTGGDGSGIYVASGSVALTNTILVGHTVGVYATSDTTATLEATLWGSGEWANYANWDGEGTVSLAGDHTGDPAFVAPDAGDYHIGGESAARDQGVNAGVNTDIDHEPRFGTPDLGADEYWAPGALKRIYLPLVVRNR